MYKADNLSVKGVKQPGTVWNKARKLEECRTCGNNMGQGAQLEECRTCWNNTGQGTQAGRM